MLIVPLMWGDKGTVFSLRWRAVQHGTPRMFHWIQAPSTEGVNLLHNLTIYTTSSPLNMLMLFSNQALHDVSESFQGSFLKMATLLSNRWFFNNYWRSRAWSENTRDPQLLGRKVGPQKRPWGWGFDRDLERHSIGIAYLRWLLIRRDPKKLRFLLRLLVALQAHPALWHPWQVLWQWSWCRTLAGEAIRIAFKLWRRFKIIQDLCDAEESDRLYSAFWWKEHVSGVYISWHAESPDLAREAHWCHLRKDSSYQADVLCLIQSPFLPSHGEGRV